MMGTDARLRQPYFFSGAFPVFSRTLSHLVAAARASFLPPWLKSPKYAVNFGRQPLAERRCPTRTTYP